MAAAPAGEIYRLVDGWVTRRATGEAVDGASVTFRNPNLATSITAYTDLAHTTAVSWPLRTDEDGYYSCYVAPGTTYDLYIVFAAWDISETWGHYFVGEPDSLAMQVGGIDTLKPTSGRTVYGRAASGKDAGILDYARIDVDTLRGDRIYVLAADGDDSAAVDVALIYPDTLKSASGDTVWARASDGQDSGVTDVKYIAASEGDFTLTYSDTAKTGTGTTYYVRSNDGQNDATVNVAYANATTATVDTLVIIETLDGGVRDYVYWWLGLTTGTEGFEAWFNSYDHDVELLENLPESRIRAGKSWGVPMLRSGSIIGASMQFKVRVTGDACDSLEMWVWVNGDSIFRLAGAIDSAGVHGAYPIYYRTQAARIDTFAAGDIIFARVKGKGCDTSNSQFDHPTFRAELMYHN